MTYNIIVVSHSLICDQPIGAGGYFCCYSLTYFEYSISTLPRACELSTKPFRIRPHPQVFLKLKGAGNEITKNAGVGRETIILQVMVLYGNS
jgi:hypothetical protein